LIGCIENICADSRSLSLAYEPISSINQTARNRQYPESEFDGQLKERAR
jgi:hypothetical protein